VQSLPNFSGSLFDSLSVVLVKLLIQAGTYDRLYISSELLANHTRASLCSSCGRTVSWVPPAGDCSFVVDVVSCVVWYRLGMANVCCVCPVNAKSTDCSKCASVGLLTKVS